MPRSKFRPKRGHMLCASLRSTCKSHLTRAILYQHFSEKLHGPGCAQSTSCASPQKHLQGKRRGPHCARDAAIHSVRLRAAKIQINIWQKFPNTEIYRKKCGGPAGSTLMKDWTLRLPQEARNAGTFFGCKKYNSPRDQVVGTEACQRPTLSTQFTRPQQTASSWFQTESTVPISSIYCRIEAPFHYIILC